MAASSVVRVVTLQLEAGNAGPAEVGKILGAYGVNLREVITRYNDLTASRRGQIVPVKVTVREDRSVEMELKTPPTSYLLRRVLGIEKGSSRPGTETAAVVSQDQLREVALEKLPDLNTTDVEKAMLIVAGTARSMGLKVG